MLPGWLGGMGDSLLVGWINSVCEGAADLAQDLGSRDRPCPSVAVFEQRWERLVPMGVGDGTLRRPAAQCGNSYVPPLRVCARNVRTPQSASLGPSATVSAPSLAACSQPLSGRDRTLPELMNTAIELSGRI